MYKLVKETFESNQNYNKNWLKTQNNLNTIDEINREYFENDKMNNLYIYITNLMKKSKV